MQRNGVTLQVARKIFPCGTPCLQVVSQRNIALQVAEKVEAPLLFAMLRDKLQRVTATTAICLSNFLRGNQSQHDLL